MFHIQFIFSITDQIFTGTHFHLKLNQPKLNKKAPPCATKCESIDESQVHYSDIKNKSISAPQGTNKQATPETREAGQAERSREPEELRAREPERHGRQRGAERDCSEGVRPLSREERLARLRENELGT